MARAGTKIVNVGKRHFLMLLPTSRTKAPVKQTSAKPARKPRRVLRIDVDQDDGDWQRLGDVRPMVNEIAATLIGQVELPTVRTRACVALACDAQVHSLNKQFRGQDKPTNVLSFPRGLDMIHTRSEVELGDVILAEETLVREAGELGIPLDHHFRHLVLHGLLHLLGYDHETDEDAAEMEALETRILAGLGIPDPYAEPATHKET